MKIILDLLYSLGGIRCFVPPGGMPGPRRARMPAATIMVRLNHSKTRVNTLKYAWERINTVAGENNFSNGEIKIHQNEASAGAVHEPGHRNLKSPSAWGFWRISRFFLILVGTSRCDVPARVSEGGTNGTQNLVGHASFRRRSLRSATGTAQRASPYLE